MSPSCKPSVFPQTSSECPLCDITDSTSNISMSAWSAKSRHKVPNAVGDKRERILSLQAVTPPLGGRGRDLS